ncbi:MAG: S8 family peptidase, partial [Methanospirillum sp.]
LSYRISLAEKDNLTDLLGRLERFDKQGKYKGFFQIVDTIESIPPEDKIGESLRHLPIVTADFEFVDIELWRMEDSRLNKTLKGIKQYINDNGGKVTDDIITHSFCLIRARIGQGILQKLLALPEISVIDRPPHVTYSQSKDLDIPLEDFEIGPPPPKDSPSIIVLDTGIRASHPLLRNGVGDEIEGASLVDPDTFRNDYSDNVGHGTEVAGIALYGDIKKCNDDRHFAPDFFILSGKVLYPFPDEQGVIVGRFDERITIETLIRATIEYFSNMDERNNIINISFGTEKETFNLRQQHRLSSLLDELANERDLIFVVAAGNIEGLDIVPDRYPEYLIERNRRVKIVEPASSAYALTVGSIAQQYLSKNAEACLCPQPDFPSTFTRVGPGLNGMIKPEFVDEGGNDPYIDDRRNLHTGVFVLNPNWLEDGKLITTDIGTSFAAPRVANFIARLKKRYPSYHPNTIKALLLASAEYPLNRPPNLDFDINRCTSEERENLLNVYGYGKPNINYAESSENNHVFYIAEDEIKIDGIHFYEIYVPEEFINSPISRELSVTLTYNPRITTTRIEYFGTKLSFYLIKNTGMEDIDRYSHLIINEDIDDEESITQFPEVLLQPSRTNRSKGIHQKGCITLKQSRPAMAINKPLVLAVKCTGNWMTKNEHPNFRQKYSVVVSLKHRAAIDLLSKCILMQRTQIRVR